MVYVVYPKFWVTVISMSENEGQRYFPFSITFLVACKGAKASHK
jgi:hypothetical protein